MKRKICYITGTRADFGLMHATLRRIQQNPQLSLRVCVTGMHLSSTYGNTVKEIEKSGLPICAQIPVDVESTDGPAMARAIGTALLGMTRVFQTEKPDVVLLLGDRGEMIAGALAAIHLNIPITHVHGGDRSGTVDEPIRHAVSKLSHYHFVTTIGARERLIKMGECSDHIFVVGAPGLDGLKNLATRSRDQLCAGVGFDAGLPLGLVVFHPVVQEANQAGTQAETLLKVLKGIGIQTIWLMPNSDAGGMEIRKVLQQHSSDAKLRVLTHLERSEFISWMAAVDVMVGNSSSGIIEASSFGLPVVNIGGRQAGRERGGNVVDVDFDPSAIRQAIEADLGRRKPCVNIYGDGTAAERITALLESLPLSPSLLLKSNTY